MYSRDSKSRKGVIRMDPNCAICNAPATLACDCEAKGLELAVRQAEERMMRSIYSDIRSATPHPRQQGHMSLRPSQASHLLLRH